MTKAAVVMTMATKVKKTLDVHSEMSLATRACLILICSNFLDLQRALDSQTINATPTMPMPMRTERVKRLLPCKMRLPRLEPVLCEKLHCQAQRQHWKLHKMVWNNNNHSQLNNNSHNQLNNSHRHSHSLRHSRCNNKNLKLQNPENRQAL